MRIDFEVFTSHLERQLPFEIALERSGKLIFLSSQAPLRNDYLIDLLVAGVSETLRETLSETLRETLSETLRETLTNAETFDYFIKMTEATAGERGEVIRLYQYRIDGYVLQDVIRQKLLHVETCRVWNLIKDEDRPVSSRAVCAKLKILGTTMTPKRANEILADLQRAFRLEANGTFHSRGREVVKQ